MERKIRFTEKRSADMENSRNRQGYRNTETRGEKGTEVRYSKMD